MHCLFNQGWKIKKKFSIANEMELKGKAEAVFVNFSGHQGVVAFSSSRKRSVIDHMMKKIFIFLFGNVVSNSFMIIGVLLLCLALYFEVNPVEASVVNPLIRGSWIHIFLFVTTMPALMVLLIAGDGIVSLALMFLIQMGVFWSMGRISALLFSFIGQRKIKKAD